MAGATRAGDGARHDVVMAEIDDKLNGLIAVVDDLVRHRKGGITEWLACSPAVAHKRWPRPAR